MLTPDAGALTFYLFFILFFIYLFWIGSTDTVAYCTSGTNCPITAALHIILGNFYFSVIFFL